MQYILSFITLSVLMVGFSFSQSSSCPRELDADVIIIGAGIAGLSAAERLQEGGIDNILILEGDSRVGGRMKSVEFAGVTVPLGAAWIQGLDPTNPNLHPIYRIAQRCGGLRGIYPDFDSLVGFSSQGNEVPETAFRWDDYDTAYENTTESTSQLKASGRCADVSLRDGLMAGGWMPMTPVDYWIEWYNSEFNEGVPPKDLSLCLLLRDMTYTNFTTPGGEGGDYFVTDPKGYNSIAECIANNIREIAQTRIVLNAVVTTVDWSQENCVCVTANVSQMPGTRYCAKYVMSTVSVGVLKSGDIQFIPDLPVWKQEVIWRFDMVRSGFINLEFNEVFWNDTEIIGYINDSQPLSYPVFLNCNRFFAENPKMLTAFITSSNVDRVLSQGMPATIAEIEEILGRIYPGRDVTVVNSSTGLDWISNPLYRGTYTYHSIDLRLGDNELLGLPVGNFYISGEATATGFSGYVHGGHLSGIATAESIISADRSGASKGAANLQILSIVCFALVARFILGELIQMVNWVVVYLSR